jgi:DNA-binding NarL/FixJ family response regulator
MTSAAYSVSAPPRIRVLVADDHPMIRSGLARLVSAQPDLELVGTAADGICAVEEAERAQPDVIVLDLSMPLLDGVTATEQIRRKSPRARVLVLSSYVQEAVVLSAFNAGVHGYLTKNVSSDEVIDGIRLTHAGGSPMSEAIRRMDPRSVVDLLEDDSLPDDLEDPEGRD